MKKLFYGLGAIAAVATPVVAVVSCGSKDNAKLISSADLEKMLKDKGYSDITSTEKAFLAKTLREGEFKILPGKLQDEEHGADDFIILVKGDLTSDQKTSDANMENMSDTGWLHTNGVLRIDAPTVADDQTTSDNEAQASTVTGRWGVTKADLEGYAHVIFLQRRGTTAKPTVEVMSIYASQKYAGIGEFKNIA